MPKTQFGMTLTDFYNLDKCKLQEYSKSFPGLNYRFPRIDLNDANIKKLKYNWVYKSINTCNMAENLAHQTKWRMG